jgi:hypothetical protein
LVDEAIDHFESPVVGPASGHCRADVVQWPADTAWYELWGELPMPCRRCRRCETC